MGSSWECSGIKHLGTLASDSLLLAWAKEFYFKCFLAMSYKPSKLLRVHKLKIEDAEE